MKLIPSNESLPDALILKTVLMGPYFPVYFPNCFLVNRAKNRQAGMACRGVVVMKRAERTIF